ncbi:hypothetical protein ACFLS9_09980, partial [Bacteroidota bacterium]
FMDVLTLVGGGVLVTGQDFGPYILPAASGKDQLAVNALEAPGSPGDPRVVRYITDAIDPWDFLPSDGSLEGNEIELYNGGTWNYQNPYGYDVLITGTASVPTISGPEMQTGPVAWINDIDLDYVAQIPLPKQTGELPPSPTPPFTLPPFPPIPPLPPIPPIIPIPPVLPAFGMYALVNTGTDSLWYKFNGVLDIKIATIFYISDEFGTTILASVGEGNTHTIPGTIFGTGTFGVYGTILDGSIDESLIPPDNKYASTDAIVVPFGKLLCDEVFLNTANDVVVRLFAIIKNLVIGSGSGNVTLEDNIGLDTVTVNGGDVNIEDNNWITLLTVNSGNVFIKMFEVSFPPFSKVAGINTYPFPALNFIQEFDQNGGTTTLGSHMYVQTFDNTGGIFDFAMYDVNMWTVNPLVMHSSFSSSGTPANTEFQSTIPASKTSTISVDTKNNEIPELVFPDFNPLTGNWWGTNGLLVPNAVVYANVSVTLSSNAGVGGNTHFDIRNASSTLWINGYQLEIQGSSPAEWHTHDVYRNNHWDAGNTAPSAGSDGRVLVSGSGVILYNYDTDFVLSTLKDNGIDLEVAMEIVTAKTGFLNDLQQFEILDDPAEADHTNGSSSVKNPDLNANPDYPTDVQVWDLIFTSGDIQQHDNDITVGEDIIIAATAGEFFQDADGPFDYTGLDRNFGELIMSSISHEIKNEHPNGTIPHFRTITGSDINILPIPVSKIGQTNQTYVPIRFGKRVILGKDAGAINTYGNLNIGDGAYIERRHNNTGINGAVNWLGTVNVGIIHTDDVNDGNDFNNNPNFNANAASDMINGSTGEIPNGTTDPDVLQDLTIYLESLSGGGTHDYELSVPIQVNNKLEILGGGLDGNPTNTVTMASTVILDFHSDEDPTPVGPIIRDNLVGGPIELIYRGQAGDLATGPTEWAVTVNVLRVEMGSDGNGDGDGTPVNPFEHHTLTGSFLTGDLTVEHEVFVQNKTANSYFDLNGYHFFVNGPAPGKKSEGEVINAALPVIVTVSAPGGLLNADFECDGGGGDFYDASTVYASSNGAVVGDGFILNCNLGSSSDRVGEVDMSGRFGFSNQDEFGVAAVPPWNADPDVCRGACLGAWVAGPAVFGNFEGDFNGLSTFTSTGDFDCGDLIAGGPVVVGGNFEGGDIGPQSGTCIPGFTVHINGSGTHFALDIEACDGGGWNDCLEASNWHTVAGNVLGGSFNVGTLWVESGNVQLVRDAGGTLDVDNGNLIVEGVMAGTALLGAGPFNPALHVAPQFVTPMNPTPDYSADCYYPPGDRSALLNQTTGPFNFIVGSL